MMRCDSTTRWYGTWYSIVASSGSGRALFADDRRYCLMRKTAPPVRVMHFRTTHSHFAHEPRETNVALCYHCFFSHKHRRHEYLWCQIKPRVVLLPHISPCGLLGVILMRPLHLAFCCDELLASRRKQGKQKVSMRKSLDRIQSNQFPPHGTHQSKITMAL